MRMIEEEEEDGRCEDVQVGDDGDAMMGMIMEVNDEEVDEEMVDQAFDEVTGQELDVKEVKAARVEEVECRGMKGISGRCVPERVLGGDWSRASVREAG